MKRLALLLCLSTVGWAGVSGTMQQPVGWWQEGGGTGVVDMDGSRITITTGVEGEDVFVYRPLVENTGSIWAAIPVSTSATFVAVEVRNGVEPDADFLRLGTVNGDLVFHSRLGGDKQFLPLAPAVAQGETVSLSVQDNRVAPYAWKGGQWIQAGPVGILPGTIYTVGLSVREASANRTTVFSNVGVTGAPPRPMEPAGSTVSFPQLLEDFSEYTSPGAPDALLGHWQDGRDNQTRAVIELTEEGIGGSLAGTIFGFLDGPPGSGVVLRTLAEPLDLSAFQGLGFLARGDPPPMLINDEGQVEIVAGGVGFQAHSDEFRFFYRKLNGDGVLSACIDGVRDVSGSSDLDRHGEVCLTMRDGSDPGARHLTVSVSDDTVTVRVRRATDAETEVFELPRVPFLHECFRITRVGNRFSIEASGNGEEGTWIPIDLLNADIELTLPEQLCVGYGVASNDTAVLSQGTLSDLVLEGDSPEPPDFLPFAGTDRVETDAQGTRWAWRDIGEGIGTWRIGGNSKDRVFFHVGDASGNTAQVPLPENSLQQADWSGFYIETERIRSMGIQMEEIAHYGVALVEGAPFEGGSARLHIDHFYTGQTSPVVDPLAQNQGPLEQPGFRILSLRPLLPVEDIETVKALLEDESRTMDRESLGIRFFSYLDIFPEEPQEQFAPLRPFSTSSDVLSHDLIVEAAGFVNFTQGTQLIGVETNANLVVADIDGRDHLLRLEPEANETLIRAPLVIRETALYCLRVRAFFPQGTVPTLKGWFIPVDASPALLGDVDAGGPAVFVPQAKPQDSGGSGNALGL